MQQFRELFSEVAMAMFPITLVIFILQVTFLRLPAPVFFQFVIGSIMVFLGLFLFLLGVRIGLLPLGEVLGSSLPARGSLIIILGLSFILGFVVTVAEPDVRVLAHQVDFVSGGYISSSILITVVALGVGIFVVLAMLRTILNIPIAYLLGIGYMAVLVLSFFTPKDFVPIAFDAGGVTTGPLTVPFILALGVGVASVLRGKSSLTFGFGLVGLASIGPILAVMILGVIYG